MTDIDICVCAFRRPQLAATLASLRALQTEPDWRLRIIVADNDDTPSAQKLVMNFAAAAAPLAVHYIHAPARNISIARNACLDTAQAELIAFIDDDEIATPGWLIALAKALAANKSDIALGPVRALYDAGYPEWMREGDFHSTRPVRVRGEIVTGYTCNVLMRRTIIENRHLRFRPELGRSGGEDTVFFDALHRAQARFAYAEDAVVTETVTPDRARFSWLAMRSFRSGQTHALLLLNKNSSFAARLRYILIAATKAGFCGMMAALFSFSAIGRRRWLLRGALHAGVAARLLGQPELTPYG